MSLMTPSHSSIAGSQRQAVDNLYNEARRLGMLYDPIVQLYFQCLLREFDRDIYNILKEMAEKKHRADFLYPDQFQKYLPTKGEAKGEITIGTVIGNGYSYGFNTRDRHWIILGSTGYGKSYLSRKTIKAFVKTGRRCVIFSKKKDARSIASLFADRVVLFRLAAKNFQYNPKQGGPGISLMQATTDFVNAFTQSYALLVGSESYLLMALTELDIILGTDKDISRQASLFEIQEYINRMKHNAVSRDARYQESSLNRLNALLCTLGPVFACSQGFPIEQALNDGYSIILEVDGIAEAAALFITVSITLRLFTWMLHSNSPKPDALHIFLDDSQEIWNVNLEKRDETGLPLMGLMASRFRTAGLIVASTQVPSLTSAMLRQNCSIKIVLRQNDYEEALKTARFVGLPDNVAVELTRLQVGEAICFKPDYPYPVKVRIDPDPDIEE